MGVGPELVGGLGVQAVCPCNCSTSSAPLSRTPDPCCAAKLRATMLLTFAASDDRKLSPELLDRALRTLEGRAAPQDVLQVGAPASLPLSVQQRSF